MRHLPQCSYGHGIPTCTCWSFPNFCCDSELSFYILKVYSSLPEDQPPVGRRLPHRHHGTTSRIYHSQSRILSYSIHYITVQLTIGLYTPRFWTWSTFTRDDDVIMIQNNTYRIFSLWCQTFSPLCLVPYKKMAGQHKVVIDFAKDENVDEEGCVIYHWFSIKCIARFFNLLKCLGGMLHL